MIKKSTRLMATACGFLLVLCAAPPAWAQRSEAVRAELFGALEEQFSQADAEELALLSPRNYEEARKAYQKARQDYEEGRSLEDIEKSISESEVHLEKAFAAGTIARQVLEEPLAIRAELAQSGAFSGRQDLAEAERKLSEGAREVEGGSLDSARNKAVEASRAYRKATLELLTEVWWKEAEDQLERREDSLARERYQAAETALKAIEQNLKEMKDTDPFAVGDLLRTTRQQLDDVFANLGNGPATRSRW